MNHDVSDEAFEVVEGADSVFIGLTGAIFPRSRRTWVEVESECFLVLSSRLLCKQIVSLEQIIITTPSER